MGGIALLWMVMGGPPMGGWAGRLGSYVVCNKDHIVIHIVTTHIHSNKL